MRWTAVRTMFCAEWGKCGWRKWIRWAVLLMMPAARLSFPHPRTSFLSLSPGDSSSWKVGRVRKGGPRFLVLCSCFDSFTYLPLAHTIIFASSPSLDGPADVNRRRRNFSLVFSLYVTQTSVQGMYLRWGFLSVVGIHQAVVSFSFPAACSGLPPWICIGRHG